MAAGAAETIAQGLYRARGLVLAVLAVAAIGAAIEIGLHQLPSPEVAIRVVVVLAGIWILAIFHMRHAWLSGLAAAAPLPGLLVVFAVSGNFESLTAGYAFGLTVSLFATDEVAARIADATPAQTAAIGTLRDFGTATAAAVLIALILPLVLHWITGGFEVSWFAGAASAMSAILMVTLAAPFLKFGEVFVTGFNRVRETQERLAATLVSVAYIRWGASVAGVSVIVCALGYFGASTLGVAGALHHLWLFVFLIFAIASVVTFCLVRDWRRTCATVFSFAPAVLLALWAMAWMRDILIESTLVLFTEVSLTGFALILFAAAQGADNMRSGNDMELASARAMERKSGIAIVSALAAAFAFCAGLSSPIPPVVLLLASGAAAILIQPALAISIETIFPRRETIEARYRVR